MGNEKIYWFVVLLSLVSLIWRYKNNSFAVLIILIFYSGLTAYYGKIIENPYKLILLLISVFFLFKLNALSGLLLRERTVFLSFIVFSFSFLFSGYLNHDSVNMIISQYSKYLTPLCIFFTLVYLTKDSSENLQYYRKLFFILLHVQIALSFVKWGTVGVQEWIVGSISFEGGAVATTLPVLGFMLLWLDKHGELNRKDWIYTALLLVIAFVSLKRAIWFIMPAFVFLFVFYVPRKKNLGKLLYLVPMIPLIFYLGVRLNPTLNKEGRIWGEFDYRFVKNYVLQYNFGKSEKSKSVQLGHGRGGATLVILDKLKGNAKLNYHDFFGYGLEKMYATDYETFDKYNFGINSKGAATGIFQVYVTSGFIGIACAILLIFSIINLVVVTRIKVTIAIFMFYDFLFYNWSSMRIPAVSILLLFVIMYANKQAAVLNSKNYKPV